MAIFLKLFLWPCQEEMRLLPIFDSERMYDELLDITFSNERFTYLITLNNIGIFQFVAT
jgi:hypothetical protein